ncbi:MAG: hypothetical protein ACD_73C00442G0001, partial [uncultured bacterium]
MSKAFVKEDDLGEDDDDLEIPAFSGGGKNYITCLGAEKLKKELHELLYV